MSQSDVWLFWGGIGLLLLVPLAARAVTWPLERKLDRLQGRGRKGKIAAIFVMGAMMVVGLYLAQGPSILNMVK